MPGYRSAAGALCAATVSCLSVIAFPDACPDPVTVHAADATDDAAVAPTARPTATTAVFHRLPSQDPTPRFRDTLPPYGEMLPGAAIPYWPRE